MKISINNWEKYNERSDRISHQWFRFENRFFESAFDWGAETRLVFIYLLCEASKRAGREFEVNLRYASSMLNMKTSAISTAIEELTIFRAVTTEVRALPRDLARTYEVLAPTDRQTDRQTDSIAQAPVLDFEYLYQLYPRHEGKARGIKICLKEIINGDAYAELELAILEYASRCKAEKTEKRFIKQFSTFMGCWREYIPTSPPTKFVFKEGVEL